MASFVSIPLHDMGSRQTNCRSSSVNSIGFSRHRTKKASCVFMQTSDNYRSDAQGGSSFNYYNAGKTSDRKSRNAGDRDLLRDINEELEQDGLELKTRPKDKDVKPGMRANMDFKQRLEQPDVDVDAREYRRKLGKKMAEITATPGLVAEMDDSDRLMLTAELGLKYNSKCRVVLESYMKNGANVVVTVTKDKEGDLKKKYLPNGQWLQGFIYNADIELYGKKLYPGDEVTGYVKRIRNNGMLDISLFLTNDNPMADPKLGSTPSNMDPVERIRDELRINDGFIPLNDDSDPEAIENVLLMSQNAFRIAVGTLLRLGEIELDKRGIRATESLTIKQSKKERSATIRDQRDLLPVQGGKAAKNVEDASRYAIDAERNFFKTRYNAEEAQFEELEDVRKMRKDDRSPLRRTDDPPGMRVHRRYTNSDFKIQMAKGLAQSKQDTNSG